MFETGIQNYKVHLLHERHLEDLRLARNSDQSGLQNRGEIQPLDQIKWFRSVKQVFWTELFLVGEYNMMTANTIAVKKNENDNGFYIGSNFVLPAFRGLGLYPEIFRIVTSLVKPDYYHATILKDNLVALTVNQRLGFDITGEVDNLYTVRWNNPAKK